MKISRRFTKPGDVNVLEHDSPRSSRLILSFDEGTADDRIHPEEIEEVRRHPRDIRMDRVFASQDSARDHHDGGESVEASGFPLQQVNLDVPEEPA